MTQPQLETLFEGVTIDGVNYRKIEANLESRNGRQNWIEVTLTEGKNREVRRVLEHFGLSVSRLIRIGYGPFHIGDLPRGAAVELKKHEIQPFLTQLKRAGHL